MITAQHIINGH